MIFYNICLITFLYDKLGVLIPWINFLLNGRVGNSDCGDLEDRKREAYQLEVESNHALLDLLKKLIITSNLI